MKTVIAILNWNGKAFLEKFLPTVLKSIINVSDVEVAVIDNGSIDESIIWLKSNYPNVRLIQLEKNYGFTGGYNKGLAQINAHYYILLNSDVEVPQGWIEPLIAFMANNPNVAACMPKIKSYDQRDYFEYAGAAGGFIDKYGYPFCRGRIISNIEKDEGQYDDPREVFWATGACLMVNAKLYHESGGLEDSFFAHMEEIDLCWRLQRMGYKIICLPQSTVYHVGGGALSNESPRKLYLNYRNNLLMLYKNLPQKNYKRIILSRLILDGFAAMSYLLSFKFSYFISVIKAHWSFFKLIPQFRIKRSNEFAKEIAPAKTGIFYGSIIVRFFKSKKKIRFSDLNF